MRLMAPRGIWTTERSRDQIEVPSSAGITIVGGLFAFAAVRDAFFPHFFSLGPGHATANAAIAVVFIGLGSMIRASLTLTHTDRLP